MEEEKQTAANSPQTAQTPQVMQQTPVSTVQTSQQQPSQIPNEFKPAGFRIRYLAYFIDNLVFDLGLLAPVAILVSLAMYAKGDYSFLFSKSNNTIFITVLPLLLFIGYFVFFTFRFGATPGKLYVGIKVISMLENRLSLKKVVIREVSKQLISIALSLIGSLIIVIAFNLLIIRNIYGVLGILGGDGKEFFQHSSVSIILTAVLIVFIYFLISIFIYYKIFISLKAGKRGIQDWLAGTRVIVVKPMSRAKKIWLGVLIFLILLMPILGILAAITLISINPAKQFALANNTQRSSNVHAIANAISQYRNDNSDSVPPGIDTTVRTITDSSASATVDLCAALVPTYFADIPVDPSIGSENPEYSVCTEPGADYNSGYTVVLDPVINKITVSASGAELGETISATEPSYGVDQTNSTNNSTQSDDVRIKSDIVSISTALSIYYGKNGSFPVMGLAGLQTLVTSGYLPVLPIAGGSLGSEDYSNYIYVASPRGCVGTRENSCNKSAVFYFLTDSVASGKVWCWRSESPQRAKEVDSSECVP